MYTGAGGVCTPVVWGRGSLEQGLDRYVDLGSRPWPREREGTSWSRSALALGGCGVRAGDLCTALCTRQCVKPGCVYIAVILCILGSV